MFKFISALIAFASAQGMTLTPAGLRMVKIEKMAKRAFGNTKAYFERGHLKHAIMMGYDNIADKYGLKKLALFMKFEVGAKKFFYRGPHAKARAKRYWNTYKRAGFKTWWKYYGKSAQKLSGFNKVWWKKCLAAARYAWPKY